MKTWILDDIPAPATLGLRPTTAGSGGKLDLRPGNPALARPAAGHTPGPWTVGLDYDGAPLIVEYQCRDICRVDSRDGVSNARLIARAPDLLAENARLRAALAHIEAGSAEYPWLQRSQINQIAKSALLGKEAA